MVSDELTRMWWWQFFFVAATQFFYREIGYFADDTFCYKINQLSGCCLLSARQGVDRPFSLNEEFLINMISLLLILCLCFEHQQIVEHFESKDKTKNEPKKCKMPHQINHWWLRVVLVERVDGCPLFQTCPHLHRQPQQLLLQNHKIHSNNKLWLIVTLPVVLWQRGHHSFTHHGSFVRSVAAQVQPKKQLCFFALFFLWCLLIVCCCICVKEWWSFAVDSPFVAVNSILSPECEKEYHTGEVRSPSGLWTKIFNVDSNRFHTLTCSGCGFTQMFKTQQSMLANLIDLVIR